MMAKSVILSIKKTASTFSFLVIFFSFLIAAVVGNFIAISNFHSNIVQVTNESNYGQIIVRDSYKLNDANDTTSIPDSGQSVIKQNDWSSESWYDPNELKNDIFIDNAENYFGNNTSLYAFTEFLENLNVNSDYLYTLNSLMNLTYTLSETHIPVINPGTQEGNDAYNSYKIQVVRIPDFEENVNSFINNNNYYLLNSIVYDSGKPFNTSTDSKNLIDDNEVYLLASSNTQDLSNQDQLYLFSDIVTETDSSGNAVHTNDFLGKGNVLNIVGTAYAPQYLTPSASIASSEDKTSFNITNTDAGETLIVFVNEKTYENIFLSYLSMYQGINDYQKMVLMQSNENISFTYSIGIRSILEETFDSNISYTNFSSEITDETNYLNNEVSKFFRDSYDYSDDILITESINEVYSNPVFYEWDSTDLELNNNTYLSYQSYESYSSIAYIVSFALLIIGAIVILIIIGKHIKKSLPQIGTLKALGFKQSAISISYSLYPTIALIPSLIIGFAISPSIVTWWNSLFMKSTFINYDNVSLSVAFIVFASLVLLSVYLVFSFIFCQFISGRKTLKLIKNEFNDKPNEVVKIMDKVNNGESNLSLIYTIKNSFRSMGKTFFIFAVISGMTVLILFSFSSSSLVETSVNEAFKAVNFENLGFLNSGTSTDFVSLPGATRNYISNEEFESKVKPYNIISEDQYIPSSKTDTIGSYCSFTQNIINNMSNPIELNSEYSAIPIDQVRIFVEVTSNFAFTQDGDNLEEKINNLQSKCLLLGIDGEDVSSDFIWRITSLFDSLANKSDNSSDLEYISFYYSTYNPSNQTLAIADLATSAYFDYDANGSVSDSGERVGNVQLLIFNEDEISEFINIETSEGYEMFDYYFGDPGNLTREVTYESIDGKNEETILATRGIVDAFTAESMGLQIGDVIYIELSPKYTSPKISPTPIPVVIEDIFLSAVPFGVAIPKESSHIMEQQNDTIDGVNLDFNNYVANLVTKDVNGQKGITQSISTEFNYNPLRPTNASFELPSDFNSMFEFLNSENNYKIPDSSLIFPISFARQLVEGDIEPITDIITILMVLTLVISVVLIGLVINQAIIDSRKESNILQAMGYKATKTSTMALTGYLFIFLISFGIAVPISNSFVNLLTANTVFTQVGTIFFSISVTQILIVLGIVISIFIITWVTAYLIYSNQNPANSLRE